MITSLPAGKHNVVADVTVTYMGEIQYSWKDESFQVSVHEAGFIFYPPTKENLPYPRHAILRIPNARIEMSTAVHVYKEDEISLRMWGGAYMILIENITP